MLEEKVENLLKEKWPDAQVLIDFSDGKHMTLEIGCSELEGKPVLEQHKMVYGVLDELLKSGELHALRLKIKSK